MVFGYVFFTFFTNNMKNFQESSWRIRGSLGRDVSKDLDLVCRPGVCEYR
jgi:hypothetical protein